jgi:hypothetical protein
MNHGFAGFNQRGEVENSIEGLTLFLCRDEKVFNRGPVGELSLNKFQSGGQKIEPPMAQIVEDYRLISRFGKQLRNCTTYVPGTTSNQYLHEFTAFPERFGLP